LPKIEKSDFSISHRQGADTTRRILDTGRGWPMAGAAALDAQGWHRVCCWRPKGPGSKKNRPGSWAARGPCFGSKNLLSDAVQLQAGGGAKHVFQCGHRPGPSRKSGRLDEQWRAAFLAYSPADDRFGAPARGAAVHPSLATATHNLPNGGPKCFCRSRDLNPGDRRRKALAPANASLRRLTALPLEIPPGP